MTTKSNRVQVGEPPRAHDRERERERDALEHTRVVKTLKRGQAGSHRWVERYGDRLLCVRHREDPQAQQRYVTVELLVDTKAIKPAALPALQRQTVGTSKPSTAPTTRKEHGRSEDPRFVDVRIEAHEETTRRRAFEAGATCAPGRPVWRMPLATAPALRLLRRIVDVQS